MASEKKHSRFVTEFLLGHCKFRWSLHVMVFSIRAICRKFGQEEEFSGHILCQCPSLAVRLQPIDICKALVKQVSALALRTGPL